MNIIDEIGILAISTRLQRLSEQLRKDGAQIYSYFNIDFEPKWFPVIYTLHVKEMLSVVEIASEIGYSHPSTISLLKELEKEKIISSKKDKQDERKRLIILTAKGKELVSKMQPVWSIMTKALNEITNTQNNLLRAIEEAEQNLTRQGFFQKAIEIKSKD
ncbi:MULTISPECIES: MarR family winged helix-turn-helix transcriptional regulator [Flavobacterium]|uniref:MarR family protein n=1 Tax=Flavobacterium anhuiense TaxID=459526 RepID=A0AAC9D414_9FLAO|nr:MULTISPECIES: MarR family transcriptional regulator [Flavobacterium]AOC97205.1 Transcriptional regulator SlyA [Flavobacterium anhuiense]EJG02466.1 MarR family transcriptional regulator [Flavobacterium sp. F52]MXO07044.1 MarR family transcriptional regulator [Flavobacterium sp. HBTb2-11-1]SCY51012.1 MarR family protein [Flavobacterium anhuiense]